MKINEDHIVAHTTTMLGGGLAAFGITVARYAPETLDSHPVTATVVLGVIGLAISGMGVMISGTARDDL